MRMRTALLIGLAFEAVLVLVIVAVQGGAL